MEEQSQTNPWGNEGKEEISVVTPKSNKYTGVFIVLIIFLFLTLGGIVFVVYRSNIEVTPVITSPSSSSTGSYETYSGKYVSFEYPTGSTVEDRQSGSGDIDLSIENELFTLALTGPASGYGMYGYNYDTNNPNVVTRYQHISDGPSTEPDVNITLTPSQIIYRNTEADIIGINVDSNLVILGKEIENPSKNKYQRGQDGDYTVLSWKWAKPGTSNSVLLFTCNSKEREGMLKCTEYLDRFLTTFRVK